MKRLVAGTVTSIVVAQTCLSFPTLGNSSPIPCTRCCLRPETTAWTTLSPFAATADPFKFTIRVDSWTRSYQSAFAANVREAAFRVECSSTAFCDPATRQAGGACYHPLFWRGHENLVKYTRRVGSNKMSKQQQ